MTANVWTFAAAAMIALSPAAWPTVATADAGHAHGAGDHTEMMKRMTEEHAGHEHRHGLEAMEHASPEHMSEMLEHMTELGLALPPMNSANGYALFLEKGCVACHAINGVGGAMGPSFDAADMPSPMNVFEFAARMWRGAPAMVELQEQLFGAPIELTGQELADIIAFAHDEEEQARLSIDQVPERYREFIAP